MKSAPARRIEYLPLDDLAPAARNPKRHDVTLLRSSIGRFGFAAPALRDERTGRLVVGHGRTETLALMRNDGQDPPEGVRVDAAGRWLVPVVCGWASRSDAEAQAYLLADNRHSEAGGWDNAELGALLADIAGSDAELLDAVGWRPGELEALLAAAEPPAPVHEHAEVPATSAGYAESEEELAARRDRIAAYEPRSGPESGFTEMILVYTEADRTEAHRLIDAARRSLGAELRASEVILRALRVLTRVLDNEHADLAAVAEAPAAAPAAA